MKKKILCLSLVGLLSVSQIPPIKINEVFAETSTSSSTKSDEEIVTAPLEEKGDIDTYYDVIAGLQGGIIGSYYSYGDSSLLEECVNTTLQGRFNTGTTFGGTLKAIAEAEAQANATASASGGGASASASASSNPSAGAEAQADINVDLSIQIPRILPNVTNVISLNNSVKEVTYNPDWETISGDITSALHTNTEVMAITAEEFNYVVDDVSLANNAELPKNRKGAPYSAELFNTLGRDMVTVYEQFNYGGKYSEDPTGLIVSEDPSLNMPESYTQVLQNPDYVTADFVIMTFLKNTDHEILNHQIFFDDLGGNNVEIAGTFDIPDVGSLYNCARTSIASVFTSRSNIGQYATYYQETHPDFVFSGQPLSWEEVINLTYDLLHEYTLEPRLNEDELKYLIQIHGAKLPTGLSYEAKFKAIDLISRGIYLDSMDARDIPDTEQVLQFLMQTLYPEKRNDLKEIQLILDIQNIDTFGDTEYYYQQEGENFTVRDGGIVNVQKPVEEHTYYVEVDEQIYFRKGNGELNTSLTMYPGTGANHPSAPEGTVDVNAEYVKMPFTGKEYLKFTLPTDFQISSYMSIIRNEEMLKGLLPEGDAEFLVLNSAQTNTNVNDLPRFYIVPYVQGGVFTKDIINSEGIVEYKYAGSIETFGFEGGDIYNSYETSPKIAEDTEEGGEDSDIYYYRNYPRVAFYEASFSNARISTYSVGRDKKEYTDPEYVVLTSKVKEELTKNQTATPDSPLISKVLDFVFPSVEVMAGVDSSWFNTFRTGLSLLDGDSVATTVNNNTNTGDIHNAFEIDTITPFTGNTKYLNLNQLLTTPNSPFYTQDANVHFYDEYLTSDGEVTATVTNFGFLIEMNGSTVEVVSTPTMKRIKVGNTIKTYPTSTNLLLAEGGTLASGDLSNVYIHSDILYGDIGYYKPYDTSQASITGKTPSITESVTIGDYLDNGTTIIATNPETTSVSQETFDVSRGEDGEAITKSAKLQYFNPSINSSSLLYTKRLGDGTGQDTSGGYSQNLALANQYDAFAPYVVLLDDQYPGQLSIIVGYPEQTPITDEGLDFNSVEEVNAKLGTQYNNITTSSSYGYKYRIFEENYTDYRGTFFYQPGRGIIWVNTPDYSSGSTQEYWDGKNILPYVWNGDHFLSLNQNIENISQASQLFPFLDVSKTNSISPTMIGLSEILANNFSIVDLETNSTGIRGGTTYYGMDVVKNLSYNLDGSLNITVGNHKLELQKASSQMLKIGNKFLVNGVTTTAASDLSLTNGTNIGTSVIYQSLTDEEIEKYATDTLWGITRKWLIFIMTLIQGIIIWVIPPLLVASSSVCLILFLMDKHKIVHMILDKVDLIKICSFGIISRHTMKEHSLIIIVLGNLLFCSLMWNNVIVRIFAMIVQVIISIIQSIF